MNAGCGSGLKDAEGSVPAFDRRNW